MRVREASVIEVSAPSAWACPRRCNSGDLTRHPRHDAAHRSHEGAQDPDDERVLPSQGPAGSADSVMPFWVSYAAMAAEAQASHAANTVRPEFRSPTPTWIAVRTYRIAEMANAWTSPETLSSRAGNTRFNSEMSV